MGRFLQQQTGAVPAVGVPIFVVEIAAVADKVATPGGLDFANRAAVDQFLHLQHKGHVTHVVAQVKGAVGAHGSFENAVTAGDGDRQRFF